MYLVPAHGSIQGREGYAISRRAEIEEGGPPTRGGRQERLQRAGFHYALGETYIELGRYAEATRELSLAADETATVWFKLGNAYYNSDDLANAGAAYRKAIIIRPIT